MDRHGSRPAAVRPPDDLAALTAPAAGARGSLHAGPSGAEDQPSSGSDIHDHVRARRESMRSCHAELRTSSEAITLHFTATAEVRPPTPCSAATPTPTSATACPGISTNWHFQPAAAAIQVNYPIRFVRTANAASASIDVVSSVSDLADLAFAGKPHLPRIGNP